MSEKFGANTTDAREHRTFTIRSTRLDACYRHRSDKLIVFIHGLGSSQQAFTRMWHAEPLQSYSILTFDLPGFGASAKSKNLSYGLEELADISKFIIDSFDAKTIHLAGHSMGGAIAVLLSNQLRRQHTLANIEGNLIPHCCSTFSRSTSEMSEADFCDVGMIRLREIIAPFPPDCFNIDATLPEAFHRCATSMVQLCDSGRLLNLFLEQSVPKRYFQGSKNSDSPLLQLLPEELVTMISRSGHFPMLDNPDGFAEALAQFLSQDG